MARQPAPSLICKAVRSSHSAMGKSQRLLTVAESTPNNSFKPTPLRYANHMAGRACHMVCSTTRRGLTQVLGRFGESAQMDPTTIVQDAISGTVATVVGGLVLAGIAWLAWPVRWQIQGRAIKNLIADERRFN